MACDERKGMWLVCQPLKTVVVYSTYNRVIFNDHRTLPWGKSVTCVLELATKISDYLSLAWHLGHLHLVQCLSQVIYVDFTIFVNV